MSDDYEPVRMRLVADDTKTAPGPAARRATYATYYLNSGDPVQLVLPQSDERVIAFVQALDDDITLCGNASDAKAGAGSAIPSGNGSPWPVIDSGAVYAYAATYSGGSGTYSRVSVTAYYRS